MSRNLHNMPARYRAQFSNWRNVTATNTYGNTSGWLGGVNADLHTVNGGYQLATTQLFPTTRSLAHGMRTTNKHA